MREATSRTLVFDCAGLQLLGIVHEPHISVARNIGIVIVVGGPQYRAGSHRQFVDTSRWLANAGFPSLRFDCRGMGDSEGESPGFEDIDTDIQAAIDCLFRVYPLMDGVVLWGLCDAASASMMYGMRKDARVIGLILANPWVHTAAGAAKSYLRHYYLQRLFRRSFWSGLATGAFNPWRSLTDLFRMLGAVGLTKSSSGAPETPTFVTRMLCGISIRPVPILLLISGRDLTAKEFTALVATHGDWKAALSAGNVQLETFATFDHTFSDTGALQAINECCESWLVSRFQGTRIKAMG
jgi:exosortase A-associated hydrolase 1